MAPRLIGEAAPTLADPPPAEPPAELAGEFAAWLLGEIACQLMCANCSTESVDNGAGTMAGEPPPCSLPRLEARERCRAFFIGECACSSSGVGVAVRFCEKAIGLSSTVKLAVANLRR